MQKTSMADQCHRIVAGRSRTATGWTSPGPGIIASYLPTWVKYRQRYNKLLIKGIGQFLNGVFPSCDLHNRHTRDLADAADQFLIVRGHGVDSMFGDLYMLACLPLMCTYIFKYSPGPLYSHLHMYRYGYTEALSIWDP